MNDNLQPSQKNNLQLLQENVDKILTILSNEISIEGTIISPLDLDEFDFPTLNMCIAILCVSYDLTFEDDQLLITPFSQPLIENPKILFNPIQNGGKGKLIRYKIFSTLILSRKSFKNLLWLIFGVLTLYITTMFLSYKYKDSLILQDKLAKIKYTSLKSELERGIESPQLTALSQLTEIYLQYDETDSGIDFLSAQKAVLIEYVQEANQINGKLLLPPPGIIDKSNQSSGDQLIGIDQIPSIWSSMTLITKGTSSYVDNLLSPIKDELDELNKLATNQKQKIIQLQNLGTELINKIEKDYKTLKDTSSSSNNTINAIGGIFSNMFDYMIGTTKVSQVSNIEGKLKVAHEIFTILPSISNDLMLRFSNVPYKIGAIYNHYENILNSLLTAYAISGFIISILLAMFGWLINFLISDESLSDEEKQQLLEDAARNLSHLNMSDIITQVLGNELTQDQLEHIIEELVMSIIPVAAIQDRAKEELYLLLQEPIIQQSFQKIIQFNQKINTRSDTAKQNQLIGSFLNNVFDEINKKSTTMIVNKKKIQPPNKTNYGGKKKRTKKSKKAKKAKKVKKTKNNKKNKKIKKTKRRNH